MKTPSSHDSPEAFPLTWDEAEQCFTLPYQASLKAKLRCLMKDCFVNPVNVLPLFFLAPFDLYLMMDVSWPFAWKVVASLVMSVLTMSAIMVLQLSLAPKTLSKLKLNAEGIVDETPLKTVHYPWAQLKRMKNWDGDLFFMLSSMKRSFFPKEVFRSLDEADQIYVAVERLWKSQGANWPETVRQFALHTK